MQSMVVVREICLGISVLNPFGVRNWCKRRAAISQAGKCHNGLFVHLAFLQFFKAFHRAAFLKCILAWRHCTNKAFITVNIWICFPGGIFPVNFHSEEKQNSVLPPGSFHLKCSSHLTHSCLPDQANTTVFAVDGKSYRWKFLVWFFLGGYQPCPL